MAVFNANDDGIPYVVRVVQTYIYAYSNSAEFYFGITVTRSFAAAYD